MDDTVKRLAKILGAHNLESMGGDVRFAVDSADGARLKVSFDHRQHFMGVLLDSKGVVRADFNVGPVAKVTEDPAFPGRVALHISTLLLQIDTKPTLAVELLSQSAKQM